MSFFKKLFGSKSHQEPTQQPNLQSAPVAQAQSPEAEKMPLKLSLSKNDIFTQMHVHNRDEALQFISQKMLENGYVSADYSDALMAREVQVSTYLVNGVAIPHGVKTAKELVKKTGLIIAQFPEGVVWDDDGQVVHLAVGIAANGDEHLAVLSKLTTVVMDAELSKKLGSTASAEEISTALGIKVEDKHIEEIKDFDIQSTVKIVDEAGMHARPATLLAKMASSYADTTVRLSSNGKTVDIKSKMNLLTLGIRYEDTVVISAQGAQAQQAVDEIAAALTAGLDGNEKNTTTVD